MNTVAKFKADNEINLSNALSHIAECTLATVEMLASKKTRSNTEFKRQIAIAQKAISALVDYGVNPKGERVKSVISSGGNVSDWAESCALTCSK